MKSSKSKTQAVESIAVREFFATYGEQLKLRLVRAIKPFREAPLKRRASIARLLLSLATSNILLTKNSAVWCWRDGVFREQSVARRKAVIETMVAKRIPCVVVSRSLAPTPEMVDVLEQAVVHLFRTPLSSKAFTTEVTVLLEERFAPRTSLHGTLLEIRGVGTLIRGASGAGKSEAALALIERGHSLVADDLVKVKLLSDHTPIGFCDPLSRGFMECRGIGIINIEKLFGNRFVRIEKKIDLVVTLIEEAVNAEPDRTGLDRKYFQILGFDVPQMEIPVRTGRDIARLIEVAAMVQAARQFGYDSADDLNEKLLRKMNH